MLQQYFQSLQLFLQMKIKEPDLDTVVSHLYGPIFKKDKNVKTAYSIFTPFKNIETQEVLYLYILKTDTKNHLSEGTVSYALKKYNPFLSKVSFLQIQKNFDWAYYLIKADSYLISLDELIMLQKDCKQIMDKEYMLKTIKFLIQIYKSKKWPTFPQLTPNALGINQQGQIKICDYEFYFKKHFEMRSLTQNICSCINPMIKISLVKSSSRVCSSEDQFHKLKEDYGENFAKLIKILVIDPMEDMEKEGVINGQGKQVSIKKIQEALDEYYKTVEKDANTTLNETFEEDLKSEELFKKYNESDLITTDSVKQPFLFRDEAKKNKRKKTIQITAILLMILLITTGAMLFFFYCSKQIECDVGTFKPSDSNECLSCSDGCLRCESQSKSSCFSCSGKMFLVLNNQNDTTGACETTCVGTVLRSNLCLKAKN